MSSNEIHITPSALNAIALKKRHYHFIHRISAALLITILRHPGLPSSPSSTLLGSNLSIMLNRLYRSMAVDIEGRYVIIRHINTICLPISLLSVAPRGVRG